jgi:hypothetical protein
MGLFDRFKKHGGPGKGGAKAPEPAAPARDPRLTEAAQMPYEEGRRALSPRWQPGTQYQDRHVDTLRSRDQAAGGNINQVDLLTFRDLQLGQGQQGYFKEAKAGENIGDAAQGIGIDEADPRLENRSVATSRTAEAMGVGGVIAKTAFATHDGKKGSVSEKAAGRSMVENSDKEVTDATLLAEIGAHPEEYLGDEKGIDPFGVPGRYRKDPDTGKIYQKNAVQEIRAHDLTNPRTQKEMNDLQWIDSITGQVDRHGGNIFIDPQSGAVKGIDNDAAFGSRESDDPRKLATSTMGASHYAGLPTLVDAATAAGIRQLGEDDLRKRITPLLSPKEVEDTIARLKAVKERLRFLELAGSVVGGGEGQQHAAWDQSTYDEEAESESSYLGRSVRNYRQASEAAAAGPRSDLKVETPEEGAAWRPKPVGIQVPKHLEKAVHDMPSLTADTFDRHRPAAAKKAPGPAPAIGAHRRPKPASAPAVAAVAAPVVEPQAALSSPPKKPLPKPPATKAPDKPVPSLGNPAFKARRAMFENLAQAAAKGKPDPNRKL